MWTSWSFSRGPESCIGTHYQADLKKAFGAILKVSLLPVAGSLTVYPQGSRSSVIAKGARGDRLVFSAGAYDVVIATGRREIVWPALAIDGPLRSPVGDAPRR